MSLKTKVKVGGISNLSDARYCAGMEVDMLGFCVVEGLPNFVSKEVFHGLRGWFSGPSVVAEVYGLTSTEKISAILRDYLPDYVELSVRELKLIQMPSLSLIIYLGETGYGNWKESISSYHNQIAYILLDESCPEETIREIAERLPVLIRLNSSNVDQLLSLPIGGIALTGSSEEKPGLKNYDHLSTVLEKLEVSDQ